MLACPVESVTSLAADSRAVAPFAGALKLTVAPRTGCPKASSTNTRSGANGLPEISVWGEPDTTRIRTGAPAVLVSANTAGAAIPGPDIATVYCPATVFAVTLNDARPEESVVRTPVVAVAEGPEPGEANMTVCP